MKYTSRKKTPLKWLNFLKFFILPVQILFYIFIFVSILMELFGTDMLPHLLAPVLNIYGYSANHLGSAFWPILSILLALIILVYWVFEIERGLIKWEGLSTVLWNLYLVVMYVICSGVMVMALMYLPPSTVSTVVLGYLVNFGMKVPASFVSYIPLLVFVVVWLIAGIIYICLNIIYFVRRKALFAKDYTEEVEKETSTVEEVKTEETVPSETGEKSEAEATPTNTVEETQGEESSEEKVEETTEETPVEPEPIPEEAPKVDPVETEGYTQVISTAIENDTAEVKEPTHKVCKECGAEVLEEDAIFCTNCGKKLDE
ncbi:zinc ribbon domain-containing protein [Solobacterium sp.]|uniref:zinc ribbon domain-containing protein n=1 Tax=Solobacterium sp. TaxID=2060878 RepID=UPI001CB57323|nr:zinc ribbon domain-containing protein [Solobacterium sp.]MBF1099708.1 zinc ribbon domain-containing protein [Solobacterium sp.]